ncbi:MAG: ATP-binding protein [Promethearchaeota archaeon]
MEYTIFLNRKNELKILEQLKNKNKPKLVIIYGRRRVGKTAILKKFAEKYPALYIVARQESYIDQLKRISELTARFFKDDVLAINPFQNWDSFWVYISERADDIILILDEFPYLVQSTPALPSILQDYWDNRFSKKENSFIILCGSSINMMESLLGYKNPLYGRRTNQILIQPLSFFDAREFFPKLSLEVQIQVYSILGGTPAYLLEFDPKESILKNIREKILPPNTFLNQDPFFVLREELSELRYYFSILNSISKGNTKLGNIINDTGLGKGLVSKYLHVLIDLHIVERRVPITELEPRKSRRGIYLIRDNYFKFWFRFVFSNAHFLEQGLFDYVLEKKIKPNLNTFIGYTFEDICIEWLKQKYSQHLIGGWWKKQEEIDIIILNPNTKELILCEVKWKNLKNNDIARIFRELKRKSKLISPLYKIIGYMIIAKKIEDKNNIKENLAPNYSVFDLDDMK